VITSFPHAFYPEDLSLVGGSHCASRNSDELCSISSASPFLLREKVPGAEDARRMRGELNP
jgi:hypothetical protein